MPARDLSVAQQITLASPLLDPAQKLARLQALPRINPYLEEWAEVTQQLRVTQATDGKSPEQIKLQQEATDTDAEHDHLLAGILEVLDGVAAISTPDFAAQFTELKTRIFPDGLMMTRATYLTEAGNAVLAAQRLTAADHALLARVTHPGGTLDQTIHHWMTVARKLGEIETKRASLAAAGPSRDEVRTLRQRWNQLAKVIRAAADTEKSLTDDARKELFGAYDLEIARRGSHAASAAVDSTPAVVVQPAKPTS